MRVRRGRRENVQVAVDLPAAGLLDELLVVTGQPHPEFRLDTGPVPLPGSGGIGVQKGDQIAYLLVHRIRLPQFLRRLGIYTRSVPVAAPLGVNRNPSDPCAFIQTPSGMTLFPL